MDEHNFNLARFLITFPLHGGGGRMLNRETPEADHLVASRPDSAIFSIRLAGIDPVSRHRPTSPPFHPSWSYPPMSHDTPLKVEEHLHGETVWVALRARGAEWSWLTPQEAVRIGREWLDRYGNEQAVVTAN